MRTGFRETALALLLALLVLGVLEVALRVLGVATPEPPNEDLIGFDPGAAYLVPDPDVRGGWLTTYWGGQRPETKIPPKGMKQRVILFGGSTTLGFRAAPLGDRLDELAGVRRFETVNLGRNSYGSGRTELILRQALDRLEPDVAFVYTGDNEFVESVFRRSRFEQDSASWYVGLARSLQRTHLGNMLAGWFRTEEPRDVGPEPLLRTDSTKVWDGMTYSETLEHYEALRASLRRICAAAREHEARLVLATVLYNRFTPPWLTTCAPGQGPEAERELEALRAEARPLLPAWFEPLLPDRDHLRVRAIDWKKATDPYDDPPAELPGRRACFGPLADADPRLGDPHEWDRKVFRLYETLETLHARDPSEEERKNLQRAEELFTACLQLFPDHAQTHFELALVQYALGRDPEQVERHFLLSADHDRAPRKANERINTVIREVAAEYPEVLLVDADELFARRMPDRLTGFEWMVDHCHPNNGACHVLMADVAQAILERWPELP